MRKFTYLQYLPAFQSVARLGSIRAAGSDLRLTPSAVSLQLKRLSEITGITLFEKSGRNVRLTRAGREFSKAAALALSQLDASSYAFRDADHDGQPDSLAVSVPASLGIASMSGTIVGFAENRGIHNLTINEASTASEVDWQTSDVAVVYDNPPFAGKFSRLLSEVRLRAVCSPVLFPRLNLRHGEKGLGAIPLLHEDAGEEWAKWAVAARVSLQGSPRVYVRSVAQAIAAATQGRGVALISDVLARSHVNDGRLIEPFPVTINASCAYYVLCAPDRFHEPLIHSLVEALAEHPCFVQDRPS